jgi:hypothetical protein
MGQGVAYTVGARMDGGQRPGAFAAAILLEHERAERETKTRDKDGRGHADDGCPRKDLCRMWAITHNSAPCEPKS